MEKSRFRIISMIISVAIVITILVQGYWNYQNYQANKANFIGDVQAMLDGSVEKYYADKAKSSFINLTHFHKPIGSLPSFFDSLNYNQQKVKDTVIIKYGGNGQAISSLKQITELHADSTSMITINMNQRFGKPKKSFSDLAAKVIVSLEADSIKLSKIDSLFNASLKKNDLNLSYELVSPTNFLDSSVYQPRQNQLIVQANSSYLPDNTSILLHFSNNQLEVLKRGFLGIAISVLTAFGLIGAFYYLYQTIKNQKELAEIKNDLISNITHEFKTPIATVMSAIEGIERFNDDGDQDKTKKYLTLSTVQLQKLNGMVEKLLETSALNEDQIQLDIEEVDISSLVKKTVNSFESITKNFKFSLDIDENITSKVDVFHFENVLNNLLDNAIKYGKDTIEISLKTHKDDVKLSVMNNGTSIPKEHQNRVFEKFFRVPSGNTHDIKGYGIGLYYCKKIIEKHGGQISLESKSQQTTVEITLCATL